MKYYNMFHHYFLDLKLKYFEDVGYNYSLFQKILKQIIN